MTAIEETTNVLMCFDEDDIHGFAAESSNYYFIISAFAALSAGKSTFKDFEDSSDIINHLINVIVDDIVNAAKFNDKQQVRDLVWRKLAFMAKDNSASFNRYGYSSPFVKDILWKWPMIDVGSFTTGGSLRDFNEFSALKLFGYTVGKTNGWPTLKRQAFLRDFITMELPAKVSEMFGSEYGQPGTTTRLRKTAMVIAANCALRIKIDPDKYRNAIDDWESDLAFLKREFYDGMGLKFQPWPTSKNS